MTGPRPRDHVAAMTVYGVAPVELPPGVGPVWLNMNESALPPSPAAIAAGSDALRRGHLYSDADWAGLPAAIAGVHGLDAKHILVGAGSMELLGACIAAYAGPGDTVLSTEFAYAYFNVATKAAQADYVAVAEPGMRVSVDALLDAMTPETRVVLICNPGNPTGTRIGRDDIVRLRDGLSGDVLLVIDEAYAEFADHLGERMFDLVERCNTVVTRTLSKAYALAGLRVGWGLFPSAVAEQVRKLIIPGSVTGPSLAAAEAAMRDRTYMRRICEETAERRDRFATALRDLGLGVTESHTNFLLIDFGDGTRAGRADAALRSRGIVLRPMGFYGLPHCLRVTIGDEDHMTAFIDALVAWRKMED